MKRALVNDWYYVNGGAEKVVKAINSIWNDFDHFATIDFLDDDSRKFILNGKKATTTFIQKLPGAKNNHRKYLQLFPLAVEQLNLSEYDIIISSSSSVAKGVLTNHNQLHICYCHSPARYAWDLYQFYLYRAKLQRGIKALYAKWVLHKFRIWDVLNSNRVDYFIANSEYIAQRIKKIYNRDSVVIYPPVDTSHYTLEEQKKDYYVTASRMVPYKKIDLIVEAFSKMPDKKLVVFGDGPDLKNIKRTAGSNIEFRGYATKEQLKAGFQHAKAFVHAADEDFGIAPIEAQACGTPVIAYGKGGLLETVIPNVTGVFFKEQTAESIRQAVEKFEGIKFNYAEIRKHAEKFSTEKFTQKFKEFVEEKYSIHMNQRGSITE